MRRSPKIARTPFARRPARRGHKSVSSRVRPIGNTPLLPPAAEANLGPVLGRYRAALRWTTGAEAKAYGFTLLIWSTGTFLFYYHGFARPHEVILFVAGAFTGMAATVLIAFGGVRATWQKGEEPRRYAYGAVHLLSVTLGILAAWAIAATLPRTRRRRS
jgi:hypothetical protein